MKTIDVGVEYNPKDVAFRDFSNPDSYVLPEIIRIHINKDSVDIVNHAEKIRADHNFKEVVIEAPFSFEMFGEDGECLKDVGTYEVVVSGYGVYVRLIDNELTGLVLETECFMDKLQQLIQK